MSPAGNDVEDVSLELEEPVDNPGDKSRNDIIRIAQNSFATFGLLWFLTTGRLVSVTVHFAELSK